MGLQLERRRWVSVNDVSQRAVSLAYILVLNATLDRATVFIITTITEMLLQDYRVSSRLPGVH